MNMNEDSEFENKLTNFIADKKSKIISISNNLSMNDNPIIIFKDRQSITNEVNQCIIKYGQSKNNLFVCSGDNQEKRLVITDKTITEEGQPPYILTDLVLNKYFPLNPVQEYHHFTKIKAFDSIIKTKKLKLASVAKRFDEDEYLPFYNAHNMNGYTFLTDNGKKLGEEICENSFYISFTDNVLTKFQEDYMWDEFADNRKGVRLVFKLRNETKLDLRKMYYPPDKNNKSIELLMELLEISSKRNRNFVLYGLSKIGFFYLPHKFKVEKEYRLLIQREIACKNLNLHIQKDTCDCKEYEYIEIPFNDKNFPIHLQLEKIIISEKKYKTKIERIIENTEFNKIPIVLSH